MVNMLNCKLNNNTNMNLFYIHRILVVHEDITIINANVNYQLNIIINVVLYINHILYIEVSYAIKCN